MSEKGEEKVTAECTPVNLTFQGSVVLLTKVTLLPGSRKCGSHFGERRHTLLQHLDAVPLYRDGPLINGDVPQALNVEFPA